jgi:hypothetical protein
MLYRVERVLFGSLRLHQCYWCGGKYPKVTVVGRQNKIYNICERCIKRRAVTHTESEIDLED